jgi:Sec-independent protein translocase protein TatA
MSQIAVPLQDMIAARRGAQQQAYTSVPVVGQQQQLFIGQGESESGGGILDPMSWSWSSLIIPGIIILLLLATLAISIAALVFAIKASKKSCDCDTEELILSQGTGNDTVQTTNGTTGESSTGSTTTTTTATEATSTSETSFDNSGLTTGSTTTTTGAPQGRRRFSPRRKHSQEAQAV